MAEFHLRGHVPLASPAYVERDFVDVSFAELAAGRWVLLLGPRQHGKTSGLVRLRAQLEDAGIQAVRVNLQAMPPVGSYEDLLRWFAAQIARQLDVDLQGPTGIDVHEVESWLGQALPDSSGPITILIDEAAGVRNAEMRSTLYRQLRALHDTRESPLVPQLGSTLTLLFSGTFEPDRLVADSLTSPFNVCQTVETEDLEIEDVRALVEAVGASEAEPFIEAAFDLVGGQPFLLQFLLDAAQAGDGAVPAAERFERASNELRSGSSAHLQALFGLVVSDPAMRGLARRCLESGDGAPFSATPNHRLLTIIGFARQDDARMVVRNPLYEEVGRAHPLLFPEDVGEAETVLAAPPGQGAFEFVVDEELRKFAEEMAAGAFSALNNGHRRLSLVGFGSVLEAVLIDALEQTDAAELETATRQADPNFNQHEDRAQPSTWRLVNLARVADELPRLEHASLQAIDALRNWRNLIHPELARQAGQSDAELEPETEAGRGLLGILVRELS